MKLHCENCDVLIREVSEEEAWDWHLDSKILCSNCEEKEVERPKVWSEIPEEELPF